MRGEYGCAIKAGKSSILNVRNNQLANWNYADNIIFSVNLNLDEHAPDTICKCGCIAQQFQNMCLQFLYMNIFEKNKVNKSMLNFELENLTL